MASPVSNRGVHFFHLRREEPVGAPTVAAYSVSRAQVENEQLCFRSSLSQLMEKHLSSKDGPDELEDVVELHGLRAAELNGQTGLEVEIFKTDGEAASTGLESRMPCIYCI